MNFYQQLGFLVFGSRLKRLGDSFLSDVNKVYRSRNVQFDASWFPVFYLLSQRAEVSIKEISDSLSVSHSAISQLITGLQQKGLIKSVVSKKDARHKTVTLTAKGQKLLAKIQPVWNALEEAMEQLANENAQTRKILEALTTMEKNLQRETVFDRVETILNKKVAING